MPATAGRVRMPANNRVHSSAALQTHGIWQSAIGYDPYAPNKDEKKDKSAQKSSIPEPEGENAYASFQGLLALARITGSNADEVRGACKKCGRVGHLTFQCRNFLSAKDEGDREGKDSDAIQSAVLTGLEKLNGVRVKGREKPAVESSDEDEEESETSDSGYDSEIERAIAGKHGKRFGGWRSKVSKSSKKKDENESDEDRGGRKRGRSTKRSVKSGRSDSADEEEVRRKKRKEKRRRDDDDSLDEEEEERRRKRRKSRKEKGRRSRRHPDDDISDDSPQQRHKRRRRRGYSVSDSDDNGLDNSRVGRGKKRSGKKSRKHHREDE